MTSHWIRKTLFFACATLVSSLILSFAVGEFIVRHTNPQWKYVIPGFRNSHLAILFGQALEQYSPKTTDRVKRILGVKPDIARVSDEENRQCIYEGVCGERMSEMKERAKRNRRFSRPYSPKENTESSLKKRRGFSLTFFRFFRRAKANHTSTNETVIQTHVATRSSLMPY